MNTIKVSHRDLAKMFVRSMPLEGQEFGDKVEEYIEIINALPAPAKIALKSAYIFSRKVPREEREDLYQELVLAVLKAQVDDERLAYTICRCDWQNWWQKFKTRQHFQAGSLNRAIEDAEGGIVEFGELLVGEVDFDRRMDGELDSKALYEQLPGWVKSIVDKRLIGKSITGGERHLLNKWVNTRPTILASYGS